MHSSFEEIGRRINGFGFSTPVFGLEVSWNPPESDRRIARDLIHELENRRALYTEFSMQTAPYAVKSILEIKNNLTEYLQRCSNPTSLIFKAIRHMRAGCREFLSEVEYLDTGSISGIGSWTRDNQKFFLALGQLRSIFGIQVAQIATAYRIPL